MNSLRSIILFFLATSVFAQTQDPHLQKGVELLRRQQFAAALPELELAHRAQPSAPEIENLLGITFTQLDQLPTADAHYRKAIVLNPKLPSPHKNLGFNQLNEKRYREAERELKLAHALDSSDQFTLYYLATLYLATSQDALAVEQLPASVILLANDPENRFLMAKACLNTGHTPEALDLIQSLTQAQLTPSEEYELAVLLSAKQLYSEAVMRFEYVLAADPKSWAAQYDLALAQINAGQTDKAILILQSLVQQQPTNPAILSFLGSAYESTNQLPQALDAYLKAVQADPQNPDCYLDYTRLLMDLDRTDEATKVIEEGINGIGSTEDPYALDLRLGVLRLKQARFDDARTAFNQAIALHPDLVVGYVALAQSFMQQGSDEKAIEPLLKARAAIPQDATLEYYVGLVSLRLGKVSEAENALKNSIMLRPDVVESHYQLGKLYSQTDRISQARSEFERVIALAPANSNARYQLSKIYAKLGDTLRAAEMADETKRLMQSKRESALARQKSRLATFQAPQ
jgi:tetratricopeptide (TPR) repeat protein